MMSRTGVLEMSDIERGRAFLVRQVVEDRMRQREGAERLGISVRQIRVARFSP